MTIIVLSVLLVRIDIVLYSLYYNGNVGALVVVIMSEVGFTTTYAISAYHH
jgi:hypothetical protein